LRPGSERRKNEAESENDREIRRMGPRWRTHRV
jgi:hypothetical protein